MRPVLVLRGMKGFILTTGATVARITTAVFTVVSPVPQLSGYPTLVGAAAWYMRSDT